MHYVLVNEELADLEEDFISKDQSFTESSQGLCYRVETLQKAMELEESLFMGKR